MLHCPATLLVARHGQAGYEHPGVVSDEGGWLTDLGREQVAGLAASLTGRRVAAAYSSTLGRAVESAGMAAAALGVDATAVDGLHEFLAGDLAGRREDDPELGALFRAWLAAGPEAPLPGGAETGTSVLDRYRRALEGIADQHRGETVLVVSHGGIMGYALPRLAGNTDDDAGSSGYLRNGALVEVTADEHGFEIVSWPELVAWPAPEPPPG